MKRILVSIVTATFLLGIKIVVADPCDNNSSSNTSLLITATVVPGPPDLPPPAFNNTQIAGDDFVIYLTAYSRKKQCGIAKSYTGTKNIRFYTTYTNPTSGTVKMTINDSPVANSVNATQTIQPVTFTNGTAAVMGNYQDAGQLVLNVIDTENEKLSGKSGKFIVIPAKFAIQIPNNTATQTISPSIQAVLGCLKNSVFQKAGLGFTVNVQPQNLQGTVTPNYGNEINPEGILLESSALLAPAGGRNGSANIGTIANGNSFTKVTNGSGPFGTAPYFTGNNFSFDEVGCINLKASIASANYLGSGSNVQNTIVVGRFTPDYFSVSGNSPEFETMNVGESESFTYLDQTFNYITVPILTVTARAASGTTTENYTGDFWKLDSSNFGSIYNQAYYPINSTDSIPALKLLATMTEPTFVDNANGTGDYTFSGGNGLQIQKGALHSPPFTAEIQLKIPRITDSDGVGCMGTGCFLAGYVFGEITPGNGIIFSGAGSGNGKQFLEGRLVVTDVSGPSTTALIVPMQTQYYTTHGFVLNTFDSTTTFVRGVKSLMLTFGSGISTTATLPVPAIFKNGILNITLSAPNAAGYANIEANLSDTGAGLPWLEYAWPNSTTGDPIGRATFGIPQGNPQIIFEKEKIPGVKP